MKRSRRVEITVETHERVELRADLKRELMWCPQCSTHVWMATPEQAAAIASVSVRTLHRWADAGKVHSRTRPGGLWVVCLASLSRKRRKKLIAGD